MWRSFKKLNHRHACVTRASEGRTGKAVELSAYQVAERVAGQSINRQQDYVEQQN